MENVLWVINVGNSRIGDDRWEISGGPEGDE